MVKQYLVDWTPDQEWAVQDWDRSDAYVVLASDYAALEARCLELEAALQLIGNELSLHADQGPAGDAFRALLYPTLETPEKPLTFYDVVNCEKCGKPKITHSVVDGNPNFCACKETKAEPMPVGEHPMGGPCIHVWALTNRSAVEKGKCELCGNSVP